MQVVDSVKTPNQTANTALTTSNTSILQQSEKNINDKIKFLKKGFCLYRLKN